MFVDTTLELRMNHDEIDRRARRIDSDNTVRQKATRARAALIEYFGVEFITDGIKKNADAYASFIAMITDSGISGFENRRYQSSRSLRQELETEFKQAGFVDSDGELWLPGKDDYNEIPTSSIGPALPAIVAILEMKYEIDSTEAVREHIPEAVSTILPDEQADQPSQVDQQPERDWEAIIRNAPGFEPDAEAYVYVLELERISDSSRWFYVGERDDRFPELLSRVRSHASDFTQSRTVLRDGQEILLGNYNASMGPLGTTHHVVDVERIVPIFDSELTRLTDSDTNSCYILEIERRTAYEVAIEYETTNVLGGK